MAVSPFDSGIYAPLFADPDIADIYSDIGTVRAMLDFEAALARVQGSLGIVPADASARIDKAVAEFSPDIGRLGIGTAAAGVPVVALVEQLREAVGGEAASYVHWGATTQDAMDTGLVLQIRRTLDHLEDRLERLVRLLADLAERHRGTLMVGRTRAQQALPTTFGLKAAGWLAPLLDDAETIDALRPRLLRVQLGGAAGNLAAYGDRGLELMEALAGELSLNIPDAPWHTQRQALAEFAGWLSLVSGSLGKMAQDLVLMSQSEVAELRPGEGGGSSTMPQKSNPVGCEAVIAAARLNATLLSGMHQALIQEHERGGPGWQLEWLTLPQMVCCTGGALKNAIAAIETLVVEEARMRANLDASNGLVLAEAASFALSAHMPRAEAQALVKDACKEVAATGRPLMEELRARTGSPVDWDALADPANYLGSSDEIIDRVLAAARDRFDTGGD